MRRSFLTGTATLLIFALAAQAAPPPSGADLLAAVEANEARVAASEKALAAAQDQLTRDQAQQKTTLGAFVLHLTEFGRCYDANPDGSISVYSADPKSPEGYVVSSIRPLSYLPNSPSPLPGPLPCPPPAPAPDIVPPAPAPAPPVLPRPPPPVVPTPVPPPQTTAGVKELLYAFLFYDPNPAEAVHREKAMAAMINDPNLGASLQTLRVRWYVWPFTEPQIDSHEYRQFVGSNGPPVILIYDENRKLRDSTGRLVAQGENPVFLAPKTSAEVIALFQKIRGNP